MIRAVTFDFWNTLYVESPQSLDARRQKRAATIVRFFAAADRRVRPEAAAGALADVVERIHQLRVQEHRCLSHGELGQLIGSKLGFNLSYHQGEVLAEAVSAVALDSPPEPLDGAGQLLQQLHGRVALGLISDTGLTLGMHLWQVMERHGLAEFFKHFTWSDETFTTKPEARQFLYTLHMLDVQPTDAVHVGDLETGDISGAKAVGMRTVRVGPGEDVSVSDARAETLADIPDVLIRWGLGIQG